jgi:deazaflavin-dependent oxidoreductase (nitroreductase family)
VETDGEAQLRRRVLLPHHDGAAHRPSAPHRDLVRPAGPTFYLLSGGGDRADWVRNLLEDPAVRFEVGGQVLDATARVVDDPAEDALARRLLAAKYQGWVEGSDMSEWARTALPVAVDVVG